MSKFVIIICSLFCSTVCVTAVLHRARDSGEAIALPCGSLMQELWLVCRNVK